MEGEGRHPPASGTCEYGTMDNGEDGAMVLPKMGPWWNGCFGLLSGWALCL